MRFEIVLFILGAGICTRPWVPKMDELTAMDSLKIKIHVHPKSILNGEDVVVSWSMAAPSEKDYIGMSCGHVVNDTDYLETHEIKNRSVGSTRFHSKSSVLVVAWNFSFFRCRFTIHEMQLLFCVLQI